MSLLRSYYYDPFAEFDRMFDNAFVARFPSTQQGQVATRDTFKPRMDVHEDPKANTVTATFELPGLKKEDVHIDVHNHRLTVSGDVAASSDREEGGFAVRERCYGKFSRVLQLPTGVKLEAIKASMEHGVLTVTFPKMTPEQEPKKISIA